MIVREKIENKFVWFYYLTVVPDACSRPGRDVASDVVGRLPLVERFVAVAVVELLAVAGREAKTRV